MQPFTFIGVPIDSVGRDGGTENGPRVLRELGLAAALGGEDRGELGVRIRGEERDPQTGILASADVLEATATVRAAVADSVAAGQRPFLIGGCCAELPGALAGARDATGEIGLVYLDGHADLYDGTTSTTGEAADMPISVVLGLGPQAWVDAAGGASAKGKNVVLLGYRDQRESSEDGMRQPETLPEPPIMLPLEAVRTAGAAATAADLTVRLGTSAPFWLHFDVDVLDQDVFPATDYLMPGGASWEEIGTILTPLLASTALIGASLACYNPDKDPDRIWGRALIESLRAASG